ncbi:hypothetical protein CsSME_00032424 [Camellia sinensis var. sinensis]
MFPFPKTIKLLLLYHFFFPLHDLIHANAPPYQFCPNTTISTNNNLFLSNLKNLLYSLSSNSSVSNFYNTITGNDQDRVFGHFLCNNFVSKDDCQNCIESASQDIQMLCGKRNEAVVWEENC